MAEVIRYVDTDASGTGTGLTWTNAYTSLSAWEAAEQTDLVSDGDWHHVYCRASSGTADTSGVTIAGWTTDSTHYIVIEAAATDFYEGGALNTSIYRLARSTAISIQIEYVSFVGLQLYNTGTGNPVILYQTANHTGAKIDRCLITGGLYGIRSLWSTVSVLVQNSTIMNASSAGVIWDYFGSSGTFELRNCVIVGNGAYGVYGYRASPTVRNCYSGNNVSDDYNNVTIITSASEDTTGTVGLREIAYSTATFTNVTSTTEDFHLVSGSGLIDEGTDLSPTYWFGDDIGIDGNTRSGSWDIGIDEYVASGGTTYNEAAAESITLAETQGALFTLVAAQAESVDLAETQADTMLIPIAMSEGLELSETQSMISTLLIALAESMGLSESQSIGTNTFDVTVSESIGLAETGAGEFTLVMGLAEGIGLSELESAIGTFALSIAESMGLTDIYTSGDLASGKISVVIASSKSAININVTKSEITITGNKSGITITGV